MRVADEKLLSEMTRCIPAAFGVTPDFYGEIGLVWKIESGKVVRVVKELVKESVKL